MLPVHSNFQNVMRIEERSNPMSEKVCESEIPLRQSFLRVFCNIPLFVYPSKVMDETKRKLRSRAFILEVNDTANFSVVVVSALSDNFETVCCLVICLPRCPRRNANVLLLWSAWIWNENQKFSRKEKHVIRLERTYKMSSLNLSLCKAWFKIGF